MEQVDWMWMIGVSIEMARQRLGWSRTTGTLEHCHSLFGRWARRLWRRCALEHEASEDWRARPLCVQNGKGRKSVVLQRFEPTEDTGSSWQVAQPAQRCSSQAGWGPKWRPVTGRQWSVPVAGYCAAVVTCRSSTRQFAWRYDTIR